MSGLTFVNVRGEVLTEQKMEQTAKAMKKPKVVHEKEPTHKGFRVVGYPPGALEAAREAHARLVKMADGAGGAPIKPFDENAWRLKTKKKPVAKPYSIHASAIECANLARKAGWTEVDVIELVAA